MNHTLTLLILIAKVGDTHPSLAMIHPGKHGDTVFSQLVRLSQ